jgi:hypothetical protein
MPHHRLTLWAWMRFHRAPPSCDCQKLVQEARVPYDGKNTSRPSGTYDTPTHSHTQQRVRKQDASKRGGGGHCHAGETPRQRGLHHGWRGGGGGEETNPIRHATCRRRWGRPHYKLHAHSHTCTWTHHFHKVEDCVAQLQLVIRSVTELERRVEVLARDPRLEDANEHLGTAPQAPWPQRQTRRVDRGHSPHDGAPKSVR